MDLEFRCMFQNGHKMVPMWLHFGHTLVTKHYRNGHKVVTALCQYGNNMVTLWLHFSHTMVTMWSQCGYNMVTLLSHYGHTLVTAKYRRPYVVLPVCLQIIIEMDNSPFHHQNKTGVVYVKLKHTGPQKFNFYQFLVMVCS